MSAELQRFELLRARQEGDVFEQAKQTYRNEIPGFQDARLSGIPRRQHLDHINAVLDEIESASAEVMGESIPFTYYPPLWNESGHFAPHIDGTFHGLAVHKNRHDMGEVDLAHPTENPNQRDKPVVYTLEGETYTRYNGVGMIGLVDKIKDARVFTGPLTKDGLTVFSQGNIGNLLPAIHHFRRDIATGYLRIASSLSDQGLSPEEIERRANNFRGALAVGEFRSLESAMREQYYEPDTIGVITAKDLLTHPGLFITGSMLRAEDYHRMNLIGRIKARHGVRVNLERARKIHAERS